MEDDPTTPGDSLSIVRQLGSRVFELSDGRFAFIGTHETEQLDPVIKTVEGASRGPDEEIVTIDREHIKEIGPHLPNA